MSIRGPLSVIGTSCGIFLNIYWWRMCRGHFILRCSWKFLPPCISILDTVKCPFLVKKNTSFLIIQNLFYTIYIEYENWRCIFMTSKSFAKPAQVTILKSYDMFSNTCNIYGKQHEAVNQCVWNIYLAEICPMPHPAFMHRRLWQLWVISLFPQK